MDELKSHYFENFKKLPALQKASLLSILFLVVLLPVGIFLSLGPVNLFPKAGGGPATPPVPITPPTTGTVEIKLSPESMSVRRGGFLVNVEVDTGGLQATAAEVHVRFDPGYLQADNISFSNAFLPVVLETPRLNNEAGVISFTVGSQAGNPVTGRGMLASIGMSTKRIGTSTIFVSDATQVAAVGTDENVRGSLVNAISRVEVVPSRRPSSFRMKFENIERQSTAKAVRVELYTSDSSATESAIVKDIVVNSDSEGVYRGEFDGVPPGEYERVYLKSPGYLRRLVGRMSVYADMVQPQYDFIRMPLRPGDLVQNNKVDIFDYNEFVEYYITGGTEGVLADFDADADVDIFDYNLFVDNFGREGD